ncbi:hypothetical protein OG979_01240 [Actinomadura citrea]|uniref:hypothetical protein n=1 Tax=Actinomadura citrea TaxID=46158 RepID=UPI002E2BE5D9|nr:hypothetical protein [Actinomadura citrea]
MRGPLEPPHGHAQRAEQRVPAGHDLERPPPGPPGGGMPMHRGGISTTHPGLGYVGLEWQRLFASATLRGVGADARHVLSRLSP